MGEIKEHTTITKKTVIALDREDIEFLLKQAYISYEGEISIEWFDMDSCEITITKRWEE